MATSSESTKDIDVTTCPICLEEFKTPKCLPCLHNFCETCLNSYIITAFKSESKSKVRKSQFKCPVCRDQVTPPDPTVAHQEWSRQFRINHLIVSLLDQNKLKAKQKLCDPCKSTDDDVTAVSWCHDCNEALCEMCVSVHKKLKMSRDHDLKNIDELENAPVINSVQSCENHKGKNIEAFCQDHNQPCCATCVAIHHRKCDNVTTLEEAANGILESKELSELLERLKRTSALNQDIINEKKENIKILEDKKCDIEKELQKTRQKIIDSFDKLQLLFMQKLTQNHNQKVKELTDSINDIENRNKVIQNCNKLIETCKTRSSETQVFLEMKKILEREKEQVEELEQILTKHKKFEYEFRLDNDIKKLITKLKTIGQIEEKVNFSPAKYPKPNRPETINLKECIPQLVSSFSIKDKCGVNTPVFGGYFMPDNTLLLALFSGQKLVLFNNNGDLIKQSGQLSGTVYDVCMLDPTTVVVTRWHGNLIDFINILTLTVNKTVSVGLWCGGITSSDNKLDVGCSHKLLILDKDGNEEKEINTNCCIYGVTIINRGEKKIVYTNYDNHSCHFVRYSDLQEVQKFTHPELEYPRGVTSDREGNVYIAGCLSGNVLQLSLEGYLLRVLLQDLDTPCGIQFDVDTDRFFISYSYAAKSITQHNITLHNITQHYNITLNYITLHNITLHNITLHNITQHYTTSHNITQHYTTLQNMRQNYITLNITHYTSLLKITQHYITLHNITHYTTLNITQHYKSLHNIT
ncbi:hypothetical protein KUTeg_011460 [Tegillarca granosa]|uniref:Uncharacterized protein n=1 Tax=Tegillarca granosa TaxID=220873 RepID=A0ABQ9F0S7_TEGGR|nr:hypothetical protein KUTeg_011460 [Tegillarca granosa]